MASLGGVARQLLGVEGVGASQKIATLECNGAPAALHCKPRPTSSRAGLAPAIGPSIQGLAPLLHAPGALRSDPGGGATAR